MNVIGRFALSALALGTLASCGGSSGPPDVPLADPVMWPSVESACASDYYQGLIGTYVGPIEYDASGSSSVGGSVCRWEAEIVISPRDASSGGQCFLGARVTSMVEQSVVLPAETGFASQCMEANDVLTLSGPADAIVDPVLGVDYTLPLRLSFQNREPEPDSGPYFGDASVSVRYVRLFGGLVPEVDFLEVDEAGITLGQRNPSSARALSGRLERE